MPRPTEWVGSDLRSRAEVAHWLKLHGGEVHDSSGLLARRIMDALGKGRALSQLLADMEADGMLKREVRGRRTFNIKLLDDWGLADDLSSQPVYRPPSADRLADTVSDAPAVDLDELAATLLARVVKLAHAPASQGAELERLRDRVSDLEAALADSRASLAHWMAEAQESATQAETMRKTIEREAAKPKRAPKAERLTAPLLDPKDRALLDRLTRGDSSTER